MSFTDPLIWSTLGAICFVVVVAEAALFTSRLFMARQPLQRYLLVLLPLLAGAWAFAMTMNAVVAYSTVMSAPHGHLSATAYEQLRMSGILYSMLLPWLELGLYIFMLFAERKVCPRVLRRPIWVLLRERGLPR